MHVQYDHTYLVIMAGGSGQRFWPWSTKSLPKQFHDFLDSGKTLLQATVERFEGIIRRENIWVITHVRYAAIVKKQLLWINKQQILCEPFSKNTAPCIAYACSQINKLNPDATLIITPADHQIQKEDLFIKAIQQALEVVYSSLSICLLGVPPKNAETGYGYMSYDKEEKGAVKTVVNFVEKPSKERAQLYIQQGNYAWNTGIFIGKIDAFVKNFQTHLSEVWNAFIDQKFSSASNKKEAQTYLTKVYNLLPTISFDQGILEKAKGIYVVCQDFGWTDLGTWHALYQHLNKDKYGNACQGQVFTLSTENCLIKGDGKQLVVTYGLNNLVIIQHQGVLLICPQDEVQNVKTLVNKLEELGYEEYV